ncbi:MAG TPA: hypothetical protein VIG24_15185 [Acidimicrobiia bacterium]
MSLIADPLEIVRVHKPGTLIILTTIHEDGATPARNEVVTMQRLDYVATPSAPRTVPHSSSPIR